MPRRATKHRNTTGRTKLVWASLALSTSLVGGVLALLVEDAGSSIGGLTLSPMVAVAGTDGVESIFRTTAPIDRPGWDSIIIGHSASAYGSPESLDARQRQLTKQGLGHHFLIGNGSGMGNGDIHVGYRWLEQSEGLYTFARAADAHAKTPIGICLIGDGNRRPFSDIQVQRLAQLVAALSRELNISVDRVFLQSDLAETASPGRYFPQAQFRELLDGLR